MRRYLALALLLVALITAILWAISSFIQPILPSGINSNLLILAAAFVAVVGVLAGLKNITELLNYVFARSSLPSETENASRRYEIIHKLQTESLEDDLHELINLFHSGVVLYLEALNERLIHDEYAKAKELMPLILSHARTAVNELRTIHTSIYSRALEEDQLSDALRIMASVWVRRISPLNHGGPSIIVECPKDLDLPKTIAEPILRIATEALTNAIFHSGILQDSSITIRIVVEKAGNQLILRVIDDGIGASEITEGYGISRMRNLVRQLNYSGTVAYLDIVPKSGKGTTVSLRVALA
jgi:two-component sensor histidine kinase